MIQNKNTQHIPVHVIDEAPSRPEVSILGRVKSALFDAATSTTETNFAEVRKARENEITEFRGKAFRRDQKEARHIIDQVGYAFLGNRSDAALFFGTYDLPNVRDKRDIDYSRGVFDGDYDALAKKTLATVFKTPRREDGSFNLLGKNSFVYRMNTLENGTPTQTPLVVEDAAWADYRGRHNQGVAALLVLTGVVKAAESPEQLARNGKGVFNHNFKLEENKGYGEQSATLPFDSTNEYHQLVAAQCKDVENPKELVFKFLYPDIFEAKQNPQPYLAMNLR